MLGLRSIRMIRTINGAFITRSLGVFTCNVCVSTHEVTVYVSSIYLGILVVLYDTHTIDVFCSFAIFKTLKQFCVQ